MTRHHEIGATHQPEDPEIVGIGHALLDAFVCASDEAIGRLGLVKGAMNPVDEGRADILVRAAHAFAPGGSMANSLAIAAAIGARTSFVGSIGDDAAGQLFADAMNDAGITLIGTPVRSGRTGLCVVHVGDDAERTMATSLGCSRAIDPADVFSDTLAGAGVLAFDGYMLDDPGTRAIALSAIVAAKAAPVPPLVVTSLGDAGCAARNADLFLHLARAELVDAVFANEREAMALTASDALLYAIDKVLRLPADFYVTRGASGVAIAGAGFHEQLPAMPVDRLVDTTGAGDAFAGGVLYGLSRDMGRIEAAAIGLKAAAEIVQQLGARPRRPLAHLDDLADDPFVDAMPNVA